MRKRYPAPFVQVFQIEGTKTIVGIDINGWAWVMTMHSTSNYDWSDGWVRMWQRRGDEQPDSPATGIIGAHGTSLEPAPTSR